MPGKYQIKAELERAIHVMDLLSEKDNFRNLSERVAFMHYLAKMLRRVSALLVLHKDKVCASIVDNSGIDYVTLTGDFAKFLRCFKNVSDKGLLRVYDEELIEESDNPYLELTVDNVMKYDEEDFHEDTFYINSNLRSAHKVLLSNSVHLYTRIENELNEIIKMLGMIQGHLDDLETEDVLHKKYDDLYKEYENNKWRSDKEKFKLHILHQIAGYQHKLEGLKNYSQIYMDQLHQDIKKCCTSSKPYRYILSKRKEISDEDLSDIFFRLHCKRTLGNCIAYFDLVKEPEHKLIFKNKAVEEFVTMLMPTIAKYDGFKYAYQYVVVLMVCDDLKLTQTDNSRRGAEYVDFMNQNLKEEFWASDSSTYNPYLRKLNGAHFGKLSKDNYYKTEYNNTEFEKLKDVYWYTLSVINKVLKLKLEPSRFAGYLRAEHPKTPPIKDFADAFAKSIDRNRLFLLRDVLNGEIKEFLEL